MQVYDGGEQTQVYVRIEPIPAGLSLSENVEREQISVNVERKADTVRDAIPYRLHATQSWLDE